ncbi:response regulator transcription factor [Planctomycetes bacterium K23_9]|uniref:Phosphate regulon transcriptional regulatory protein PhoB n=1 Tax=Stieleria marina TaxID=1930275 RepID=A0A517NWD5_9BACT|nr:Phosphate regulon transcriptional regulatory protein PhoB [Planctomycetes bacterium K23_9]
MLAYVLLGKYHHDVSERGNTVVNHESKRVIVYVANPTILDVTTFRLELIGMTAIAAGSDDQMAAEFSSALPDAVLIDLDLADGRGLYWVEKIASEECSSHIPIICVSTKGDLEQAEQAFKAGARGFLVAPYDPILLEEKLLGMLQQAASPIVGARS